ncbi:MAG: hypothetical protein JOZ48_15250 [Acidobacteriaceae bacterium]|nr:hypothetical protein [Acidobacteriaceae bacterium]
MSLHFTEEQLLDAYYDDSVPGLRAHLTTCSECQSSFDRLRDVLDSARDYPVPQRGPGYGGEVWTRVLPHLPLAKSRNRWLRWWMLAPALATLVLIAFIGGMFTQRQRQLAAISTTARERVLLIAMSEHLDRSQIMLTELINATPSTIDLADQRSRARELLNENRLLRQTAVRAGDRQDAMLLDELERVLLDVANSPSNIAPDDLQALQNRIESEGLLFKVRITSTDIRQKGQKL